MDTSPVRYDSRPAWLTGSSCAREAFEAIARRAAAAGANRSFLTGARANRCMRFVPFLGVERALLGKPSAQGNH